MITVIAWNRINSVSSLFFQHRILRFEQKYDSTSEKVLSNFNIVARQNSLNGFSNTADDDGMTAKPVAETLSPEVLREGVTGFKQLRRKVFG